MGGEDPQIAKRRINEQEAPPRGWGGHEERQETPRRAGGTPTWVGRTAARRSCPAPHRRHPHVGGEDDIAESDAGDVTEAPPRGWGGPVVWSQGVGSAGGTPTWVGRTHDDRHDDRRCRRHPHVGGEDVPLAVGVAVCREAPPRGWGGPRPEPPRRRHPVRHPHVGGEDGVEFVAVLWCDEAPPRGWGGRRRVRRGPLVRRGTPTWVGRTLCGTMNARLCGRHPHVGGEDAGGHLDMVADAEAPPRGWGGRPGFRRAISPPRGTPTRVGRTSRPGRSPGRRGEAPPRGWGGRHGVRDEAPGARGTPTRVGRTAGAGSRTRSPPRHPHAGGEDRAAGPRTRELQRGTPTRVGRTARRTDPAKIVTRHPHAGGEDYTDGKLVSTESEAPPRGWGGRPGRARYGEMPGGTPTRVGRTPQKPPANVTARRHPHAGGEDRPCAIGGAGMNGGTPTRVGRTGVKT